MARDQKDIKTNKKPQNGKKSEPNWGEGDKKLIKKKYAK